MSAHTRYFVRLGDPRAHLFHIRCELSSPDPRGQVFRLPSWLRGSYLIRDFAKHVTGLQAHYGDRPAAVERLDKRSIRIEPGPGALTLCYEVYAFDESVRKAWLDTRRAFFNGSSMFYCPAGHEAAGFEVTLETPVEPFCENWRVATTLPAVAVDARGFGRYAAPDYEALIDHPVEIADFRRFDFVAGGIPHALVISGRAELDGERVAGDLARICEVERAMFGGEPPLERFLFLTHVVGAGYGGLEHRSSTALICSRNDFPAPGETGVSRQYRQFLGLCSHEYFHLWNVKRITPQAFLESDLGSEAYTRDLWHYEGVTSYYDDLFLLRAGLVDPNTYLDLVAETATRVERAPGRALHSLADASFEAWIKYYQPDENALNATTNYYAKGALLALCLDLHLRLNGPVTLDDVMRGLWQRYGRSGAGVPEGGLEALAQELSGLDLRGFFDRYLRGTEDLPVAELLPAFGVRAERRAAHSPLDAGGRAGGAPPRAWAGLKLRPGETRIAHVLSGSPAQQAGLSPGDELLALDGLKINVNEWLRRLETLPPGRDIELHFFRGDELMSTTIRFREPPLDTWTLVLDEGASGACRERRQAWLASPQVEAK